jgi:hypothetical protein
MIGEARQLGLCAVALLAGVTSLQPAARADGDAAASESFDGRDLAAGFRAIDMLQDLKHAYDQRLADCNKATADARLCQCINNRLTLDLTYSDYLALSDRNATATLIAVDDDKRSRIAEARQVREVCTGNP